MKNVQPPPLCKPPCMDTLLVCVLEELINYISKITKHLQKIFQSFVYFNKCISNETMTNRCRMLDVTPRNFFPKEKMVYDNSTEN